MGWFCEYDTSRKALIEKLIRDRSDALSQVTCIAHCYRGNVHKGVLWTVWKITRRRYFQPTVELMIIGCDVLDCCRNKNSVEPYWWWHPLDEPMEPYHYSCPLSYLKMTEDPKNAVFQNARWREIVKDYHRQLQEKRKLTYAKKKLQREAAQKGVSGYHATECTENHHRVS